MGVGCLNPKCLRWKQQYVLVELQDSWRHSLFQIETVLWPLFCMGKKKIEF